MRYPPLLIAIFLAFLLRPFLSSQAAPQGFFLLLVFVTVIYAFRHIRSLAISMIVLGGATVTFRFIGNQWQSQAFLIISHFSTFVAMVIAMIAMLSEVLRARRASTDIIIGAVCLYLVIGLAWGFLYYSIYLVSPSSFFASPGPASLTASVSEHRFTEVLYFSFSALTTIGSSGEEPLTTMVHQLAVVESAMGQLYLAVLISRLVGFSTTGPRE
jgi:hypothetical protein